VVGTLVNTGTVLVGSATGAAIGARLPKRVHDILMDGIGLVTILIGMKLAWRTNNEALVLVSLLLGSAIGELVNIEGLLEALGRRVEERVSAFGEGDFGRAVVGPTLLFCVGPLTLMGCIQEGLTGDYSLIATKSTLDAFSSMAFGAAMGWKVMLSALAVFAIQGSLTAGSGVLQAVLTRPMQVELFATGGVILLGLGLRLLNLRQVRVANMLPALVVAPVAVWLVDAAHHVIH
jgi:uncharacterized membrane protein YqgA involved in biofilm formation